MRKGRSNHCYIVVGSKPWNRRIFDDVISKYHGKWYFIDSAGQLTLEKIAPLRPRYIFFLHWSSKVPNKLTDNYECICFHMTDVPYGRGGSPLQNLIIGGHSATKLTALKMTRSFDAGPVYLKENLSLEGNAEEIYIRATRLAAQMIQHIVKERRQSIPQTGGVIIFKRRRPEQSEIPELPSLKALYDFVRMLDAEEYPRAFIECNGFRYEFSRAALYDGRVVADVTITTLKCETS